MENKIKHICNYNEKCKIAERCTVAIEVTTFDDARKNIRRYIKGCGKCEAEKERLFEIFDNKLEESGGVSE